jgi:hypothetical protein
MVMGNRSCRRRAPCQKISYTAAAYRVTPKAHLSARWPMVGHDAQFPTPSAHGGRHPPSTLSCQAQNMR